MSGTLSNKKMSLLIVGTVLILIAVGGGVWYYTTFLSRSCNPPLPRQTITVGNTSFDVEMATTLTEQSCGLSGRTGLGDNQGMLFVFGMPTIQTFWMKDMNFPLDMIWISGNKVVGFAQDAVPQPGASLFQLKIYTSPDGTDKVLEVNSGTVLKDNIQIGDAVAGV